jgi:tetratricopeptide (TPR) repeat protein
MNSKKFMALGVVLLIAAVALGVYGYLSWQKANQATKDVDIANTYIKKELDDFASGGPANQSAFHDFLMAKKYLDDAIKIDPNLGIAYYDLAVAYGNDGFFHHYYKFPNQTKFTQAIPWYLKHGNRKMADWMHWSQWAFENATYYAKKAAEFPEVRGLAYQQLGAIYYNYADNYTARKNLVLKYDFMALNYSKQILKHSGKYGIAALYTNIARTYLAMAEPKLAAKWYWKSIHTYPIDTAYEHQTWTLIDLGNWSGAYNVSLQFLKHKEWESDLGLMPAAISAFYIGYPYYRSGNYAKMMKWWNRSLDYCNEIITKFGSSSDYYGEAARLKALIYFYLGDYYIKHNNTNIGYMYIKKSLKMLKDDVKAMTDHINNPDVPAEVPGSYYERALAYYYLGLIDSELGNNTTRNFEKAKADLVYLMNNPWMSNREVAHRNYYVLSYIGLSGVYVKLYSITKNESYLHLAKSILMKFQNVLNSNRELVGWKHMFEDKYGKNFGEGIYKQIVRVGGVPVYFGVLEH